MHVGEGAVHAGFEKPPEGRQGRLAEPVQGVGVGDEQRVPFGPSRTGRAGGGGEAVAPHQHGGALGEEVGLRAV